MATTTDRNDPRLGHGVDTDPAEPVGQHEAYLILSAEERAKGFVRPVRRSYVHWFMEDGSDVPYPVVSMKGIRGCGVQTTMNQELAETYARDPKFYGATYCVGCGLHRPVKEFIWDDHTKVGS